jgi:hypothetical protein
VAIEMNAAHLHAAGRDGLLILIRYWHPEHRAAKQPSVPAALMFVVSHRHNAAAASGLRSMMLDELGQCQHHRPALTRALGKILVTP